MEHEFDDLPPELKDALERMLQEASGEAGRQTAYAVIRRENEIWPMVQRLVEEAENDAEAAIAFDPLWIAIRGQIRATIRANLRRKDDEYVDEIEQKTAMEVLRKLAEFSIEKGTFLVWVRGIARNLARWWRTPGIQGTEIELSPSDPNQDRSLPPSACFEELLRWVQEREPHHATVFLLHQYLEWLPAEIADELGDKTIGELASLAVGEIRKKIRGLEKERSVFARLLMKAKALGDVRLRDLYGDESANDALSHWSSGVARWMRGQVIGSGKRLLIGVCELRAGAHERLTFLWSRFLRRTLDDLCPLATETLLTTLVVFRTDFPKLSDLTPEEVEHCSEPLKNDIIPGKTLAQCSRGDLADDLIIWRERIQNMVVAKCKGVVAYAYLCGALPGIVGPAKGGVA